MASTLSPNMNLIIPGVGTENGPNYAFDVNSSLTLIDQHDHSPGNGVQITPAGININADLAMNDNELTAVSAVVFSAVSSETEVQALYVKQGPETPLTNDLWFNDGNGNQVQLTSGGLVNATIASLPGESYSAGTFFWVQGNGSTTPANFDIGSITIRPNVAGTVNGVRVNPPSGISSQYDLNLPLLPVAQSFLLLDSSGNITASVPVSLGITGSMIANGTITLNKLATSVLQWNTQTFNSSGTFTVPAGVNQVYVIGAGGGGGGGGGAGSQSGTSGGGGGGGGGGAIPYLFTLPVTPAASLTVTIGIGGTGGSGGAALGNGSIGGTGANSVFDSLVFPGATGGNGGVFAGAGGGAGSGVRWASNVAGAGGASGGAGPGSAGDRSIMAAGGAAGGTSNSGGGGGGGAAGFGAGANAGGGGSPSGGGNPALANSSGGGGGGGGHGLATSSGGSAGGNGGSGRMTVYWLGSP